MPLKKEVLQVFCFLLKQYTVRHSAGIVNESDFVCEIEQLFDIAHENAMSLITIEVGKQFLQLQREGRIGYSGKEECQRWRLE